MDYLSQIIKSQRVRKSLSIVNIIGLSVCVAAALLLFLYVIFETSYDSFHNGDRIYRVESRLYEGETLTDNWATTAFGHAPAMYEEIPGIEKYVRMTAQDREQVVTYQDRQFAESRYCSAEPAFFEMFNFPILHGDQTGQLVRPGTLVLTESAARRYFGEADPIGKMLTFRTATSEKIYEVTGVIGDMPANSHIRFDFLLSYATIPQEYRNIWYIHGVYTYVRLEPDKDPREIEDAFSRISDKYKTDALKHKNWRVELIPLKDIHLIPQKPYEKETKGSKTAISILSAMAIALLLIGWVNALNLTIARILERGKEFGVRKAFGASRRQLLFQGLLEAAFINLTALIIAFGLLEVLLPVVYSWIGQNLGHTVLASSQFWLIVLTVFLSGTLFTGLYPSILLLRIRPSDIMRGKLLHSKKGNFIRKALIIVQFIASFVLITGTFVVIKQVQYMQEESSSPVMRQIVVIKYPSFTDEISTRLESFRRELKQKPHIRQVSVSGAVPGVEVANYFANRPYESHESEIKMMQMFSIDYDYLDAYSVEIVTGRGFSEAFGDDQNKVVLNEEAARLLGYPTNEEAIGKQLTMEVLQEPIQIIGIAKNYYQQSLATPYKPIVFFLRDRLPFISTPYISIWMDGTITPGQISEIEQVFKEFFPSSLFSYFLLDEFHNEQYKSDRNFGWMFAAASLLAVFVACLGLWVVTLFSTLSRVREIGIRKVLGANKITLFVVLTRELIGLTIVASVIGIPIASFLMNRWLQSYAFHISIPSWVFAITFILLVCIAFLTILRQVWRTIRLKPMRILRSE